MQLTLARDGATQPIRAIMQNFLTFSQHTSPMRWSWYIVVVAFMAPSITWRAAPKIILWPGAITLAMTWREHRATANDLTCMVRARNGLY